MAEEKQQLRHIYRIMRGDPAILKGARALCGHEAPRLIPIPVDTKLPCCGKCTKLALKELQFQ